MINLNGFKEYDAKLTPCPFCGGERQEIMGVYLRTYNKWNWSIECKSCHASFRDIGSEYEVRTAWERRYKKHEIEQDGDITWSFFDLWKQCAQRYAEECLSRLDGTDRPDTDLG